MHMRTCPSPARDTAWVDDVSFDTGQPHQHLDPVVDWTLILDVWLVGLNNLSDQS